MNTLVLLADIDLRTGGSGGLVHNLLIIFVVIVCCLIVWALGNWGFPQLGAPPIVLKIWNGLFILIAAIAVINFLCSLVGHGFITW